MPARARNIGAEISREDILVFVDSDAYMAPDWIEKILKRIEDGCRLGGGAILLPESQKHKWIPTAQYFLQFNEYMDNGNARVKPFLPSCNMFCDREIYDLAGGFPELRASEDVLFFLKAGVFAKVWFIPEAKVFHIFRESVSSMIKNQRLLGKYVLIYRRLAEKSRFYYRGFWPLLFLPVFMSVKLLRILKRLVVSRGDILLQFILFSPAFLLGFMFWGVGLVEGILAVEPKEVRGLEAWSF